METSWRIHAFNCCLLCCVLLERKCSMQTTYMEFYGEFNGMCFVLCIVILSIRCDVMWCDHVKVQLYFFCSALFFVHYDRTSERMNDTHCRAFFFLSSHSLLLFLGDDVRFVLSLNLCLSHSFSQSLTHTLLDALSMDLCQLRG